MNNIISLILANNSTDTPKGGEANKFIPFILLGVMLVVMVVLTIIPQRKRKKQAQEMNASLKIGTKVMTAGGIVGEIVGFDDANGLVILNIARNGEQMHIAMNRNSIATILNPATASILKTDKNITEKSEAEKADEPAVTTADEIEAKEKKAAKEEKKKNKKSNENTETEVKE